MEAISVFFKKKYTFLLTVFLVGVTPTGQTHAYFGFLKSIFAPPMRLWKVLTKTDFTPANIPSKEELAHSELLTAMVERENTHLVWPFNIICRGLELFGHSCTPLPQPGSFPQRLCKAIDTNKARYNQDSDFIAQHKDNPAALKQRALALLNKYFSDIKKLKNDEYASFLCKFHGMAIAQLTTGQDKFNNIARAYRLLDAAGEPTISQSHLAAELYRQSREVAHQGKFRLLREVTPWAKKFDLTKAIAAVKKLEKIEFPDELETFGLY